MLVVKELLPNAAEHTLQEVKLVSLSNASKATNIRNDIMQTLDYLNANVCNHFTATSKLSSSGLMLVTMAVSDDLVASGTIVQNNKLS